MLLATPLRRRRRRQRPNRRYDEAQLRLEDFPDPLAGAEADEARQVGQLYRRALEQVRGEFEERTWQAFWLVAVEGRTTAEVAAQTGVSPAAVRQAKSRVLRRLRQELLGRSST